MRCRGRVAAAEKRKVLSGPDSGEAAHVSVRVLAHMCVCVGVSVPEWMRTRHFQIRGPPQGALSLPSRSPWGTWTEAAPAYSGAREPWPGREY
jgi:hypothetical protein